MEIKYKLSEHENLLFYGEEINYRHDFFVRANCSLKEINTLFFFDSRGISKDYEHSLIKKIVDEMSFLNYLIIGRPIEITIWMTLYNFIQMNNLRPKQIITNMGFVDFTPKKESIIKKSIYQYIPFFSNEKKKVDFVEKYKSGNEGIIDLYIQEYPIVFISELISLLHNFNVIVINTPTLIEGYQLERKRPSAFFQCIEKSNAFNSAIGSRVKVINFSQFSEKETYDGVHYTESGNILIFSELKCYLIK